ncbi:hypothetical protein [Duganella sp. BJB476]|nr:hypothetical protein [Duganella sp. BJB476]
MQVTQSYKENHEFRENMIAAIISVALIACGPVLSALGLLRG